MIKTVLSIDDDQITQLLYKIVVESTSFCEKIIDVYNGVEALSFYEKIETENQLELLPEVILLDLNMPLLDGWEFFETFEKRFPQFAAKTKIFILSSSINPADVTRAKSEKKILSFLSKPFDEKQIQVAKSLLSKT